MNPETVRSLIAGGVGWEGSNWREVTGRGSLSDPECETFKPITPWVK